MASPRGRQNVLLAGHQELTKLENRKTPLFSTQITSVPVDEMKNAENGGVNFSKFRTFT